MATFHGTESKLAVDTDAGVVVGDWLATDQVQSLSFEFEGNLVDVYMLGDRDPQEIKEGTIAISGSITRLFGVDNFSSAGVPFMEMATAAVLDEFWVALYPDGAAAAVILVSNCKFGTYSLGVDVNGLVTETASFHGKAIGVT